MQSVISETDRGPQLCPEGAGCEQAADVGRAFGIWSQLDPGETGASRSEAIAVAAKANFGHAGPSFLAVDQVQAGPGDRVIVMSEGNGVRQILKIGDQVPIRSVIVGIVDALDAPT